MNDRCCFGNRLPRECEERKREEPSIMEVWLKASAAVHNAVESAIRRRAPAIAILEEARKNVEGAYTIAKEALASANATSLQYEASLPARVKKYVDDLMATAKSKSQTKRNQKKQWESRSGKIQRAIVDGHDRPYLKILGDILQKGGDAAAREEAVYQEYLKQRELPGNRKSPSFYIYCARLFYAAECSVKLPVRIITNTLELNVQDVQMFRSVGYFMLEIGSLDGAVELFRRVQDKAPGEPQSFLDLGLALFFRVRARIRDKGGKDVNDGDIEELKEAIDNMAQVLIGKWMSRFHEIEWPGTIWLNWMVNYADYVGVGDLWPEEKVERSFHIPNFELDIVCAMAWDTDHTDIDLHVFEPCGEHIYFANKVSSKGGSLSRDFTQGYGPEVYTIKEGELGIYTIRAHYFGSHQVSANTGTTSCVLWSVKHFGVYDREEYNFQMVRLERNKSDLDVLMIDMCEDANRSS
eukprot:TRINITY_DN7847_c0_g1_i1.p1 TRINITY_DN7847_c0_g1~~TRINITY_DN7847_c0_g1_i1.p1  ORF type:complete len:515 (-),score=100.90 TRINITY_DN7847_c0_g1_i1:23-1423(-)